jgi:hypothetical protein
MSLLSTSIGASSELILFFSASLLPTYVKQESSSECWLYFGNVPPLLFGRKLVSFLKPLIEFRGAE